MNKLVIFVYLTICCLFFLENFQVHAGPNDLRSVIVIHRHGDRYQTVTFPGDLNVNLSDNYGSLSLKGRLRLYTVGRNLRLKFPELTRRNFTYLASSKRERCIESVKLLLLGLDGPVTRLDKLQYPVVHKSDNLNEDPMLNHGALDCPVRKEAILSNEKINNFPKEFPVLWSNISQVTNETYNESNAFFVFDMRCGPIFSALAMGLDMPEPINTSETYLQCDIVQNKAILYLSEMSIEKRLTGVFYKEVINRFENAMESSRSGEISFHAYATHDTTLGPVMYHMDLWPGRRPLYGEALIFVLKENASLDVYFYDEHHVIHQQSPFGLKELTLKTFQSHVEHLIPTNWKAECGRSD